MGAVRARAGRPWLACPWWWPSGAAEVAGPGRRRRRRRVRRRRCPGPGRAAPYAARRTHPTPYRWPATDVERGGSGGDLPRAGRGRIRGGDRSADRAGPERHQSGDRPPRRPGPVPGQPGRSSRRRRATPTQDPQARRRPHGASAAHDTRFGSSNRTPMCGERDTVAPSGCPSATIRPRRRIATVVKVRQNCGSGSGWPARRSSVDIAPCALWPPGRRAGSLAGSGLSPGCGRSVLQRVAVVGRSP